ncbi:hypothetical protein FOMPIDRAFT_1023626 [Fomitopsis schrenkii]|uniref:Uncharacterized protein n=1 Tax=Fomitopsis schrenkii TaxID=2126942 RepID=S8E6I3_FOMSC|nr:hypothetical protein FOMPIDRAFT_1023626 [Fomitopsis schrenkii]
MARAKKIAKISNRDRTLYTLHDLGHKSFKREQFVMEARAHSERAGEAWSKRADANVLSELDALVRWPSDHIELWHWLSHTFPGSLRTESSSGTRTGRNAGYPMMRRQSSLNTA